MTNSPRGSKFRQTTGNSTKLLGDHVCQQGPGSQLPLSVAQCLACMRGKLSRMFLSEGINEYLFFYLLQQTTIAAN